MIKRYDDNLPEFTTYEQKDAKYRQQRAEWRKLNPAKSYDK